MSDFDIHDVSCFLLGRAPNDVAQAIEKRAQSDPELAAQLALMGAIGRASLIPSAEHPPVQGSLALPELRASSRAFARPRTLGAVVLAASLLAGFVWAGWEFVRPRPLLQDSFDDGWYDSSIWRAPPEHIRNGGVREEHGYLRLINRGYLVTFKEYPSSIDLAFDWKWINLGLKPQYSDHLTVALRTSGSPSPDRPYEVLDGIVVKFNVWNGDIQVSSPNDHSVRAATAEGVLRTPADAWHRVRITDDGEKIAIYCTGPELPSQEPPKPILEIHCPQPSPRHHVAIYNRELVDHPHESYIDNVELRTLKTK